MSQIRNFQLSTLSIAIASVFQFAVADTYNIISNSQYEYQSSYYPIENENFDYEELIGNNLSGNTINVVSNSSDSLYSIGSGAFTVSEEVKENKVYLESAHVENIAGGYNGWYPNTLSVHHNELYIYGGEVEKQAVGGGSWTGSSYNNELHFDYGIVNGDVFGGASLGNNAYNNLLNIGYKGIKGNAYGGYSLQNNNVSVYNNSVIINCFVLTSGGNDACVNGNVYGGYLADWGNTGGSVKNNTVTIISGEIEGTIYGGDIENTVNSNNISGNKLKIGESSSRPVNINYTSAGNIANFENIEFYLPQTVQNNETALKLTANEDTDLSKTKTINAYLKDATGLTDISDKIHLIEKVGGGEITGYTNQGRARLTNVNIGGLLNVKGKIELTDPQHLDLTFAANTTPTTPNTPSTPSTNPITPKPNQTQPVYNPTPPTQNTPNITATSQSKSLLETHLSRMVLLNHGDEFEDLIPIDTQKPIFTFGAIKTFDTRTKTGSHIDADGNLLNAGVGTNIDINDNFLGTAIAHIEYGAGDYKSYLDDGTKGQGEDEYIGLGLTGRLTTANKWYAEGKLRSGRTKTDYQGMFNSFDLNNNYYSGRIAIGKIIPINNNNKLDIFTRYAYSKINGQDKNIKGLDIHFDNINSHRFQIGAKNQFQLNDNHFLYGKAIYQYETDGKANGYISFLGSKDNIPSPNLKGSTVMGELGYTYSNGSIEFQTGIKAYTGKERGVAGKVGLTVKF